MALRLLIVSHPRLHRSAGISRDVNSVFLASCHTIDHEIWRWIIPSTLAQFLSAKYLQIEVA
jgi:hypothetical protein